MKQQDILAVIKHIVDRQVNNTPDKVFRFKTVSKTRKTRDEELRKPAKYPGDPSDELDMPTAERPWPVKKARKPWAKKTAPQDKVGCALQQEMEGLINFAEPPTEDRTGAQEPPPALPEQATEEAENNNAPSVQELDPLDIADQSTIVPNYGGIPNFGPNDPVQHPWPKPAPAHTTMFGRYRYPMSPGPIEPYPAGIAPEDIGVIDPSLIGLRASPAHLPTPRASVTPQLSPLKLGSDSSVSDRSRLRYEVHREPLGTLATTPPAPNPPQSQPAQVHEQRPAPQGKRTKGKEPAQAPAKQPAKRGRPKRTLPVVTEEATAPAPTNDIAVPPKPRPRGKAAQDLAPVAESSGTNLTESAVPVPTPSRRTADSLAASEAAQLNLPAKRVRTAKVRTT